jgi:SPP1 family predicted phage head-tail adaptor
MRPGAISEPIEYMRKSKTDDGFGGFTFTWTKHDDDWAQVMHGSGSESEAHDRIEAKDTDIFRVRFRDDLRESDAIDYDGVFYNIRVLPTLPTRSMYMDIVAERGVAQ